MLVFPSQFFLLQNLVDYAGLFPPAGLSLESSLANYRRYQQGEAAFLLGRLICPSSRLGDLSALLVADDELLLSVLVQDPQEVEAIEEFHRNVSPRVRVDTLEVRWNGLESARAWLQRWNYSMFFEVQGTQVEPAARVVAEVGRRAGLKLRTGSIEPEGFPALSSIAEFLSIASQYAVPYKCTAGLHHARNGHYRLTYEPESPSGPMLGFLTLFGIACLHWHRQLPASTLVEALQDGQLEVTQSALQWRDYRVTLEQIQEFRACGGRSFGSCSFDEPHQELREMGWIC